VLCSHQPPAQRGKALRIKERKIRRSRCETDAIRTSIASTCPPMQAGLAAHLFASVMALLSDWSLARRRPASLMVGKRGKYVLTPNEYRRESDASQIA
jgi:hypothetical protein